MKKRSLSALMVLAVLLAACQDITSVFDPPATSSGITSFTVATAGGAIPAMIDNEHRTIHVSLPMGEDWSQLIADVAYLGQSLDPPSLVPQDFTKPLSYTVLSTLGQRIEYKVHVVNQLDILAFGDDLVSTGMVADFERRYDVRVNLAIVNPEDVPLELENRLKSGQGIPDVTMAEAMNVKEVLNWGVFEDLEAAPYDADVTDQFPYAAQMGRDRLGTLRGITWQTAPGGFFYRRSAAQATWGDSSPAFVQSKVDTWAHFLSAGADLKAKGIALVGSPGELSNVFYAAKKVPFYNASLQWSLDPAIRSYLETATSLASAGLEVGAGPWSPEWFSGMNAPSGSAKIFGYFLPTWGLHYVLKNQTGGAGDWGVVQGPSPYYWGGTWMSILSSSQKKEAAWNFVQMLTQDVAYMKTYAQRTGDFSSNKTVVNELKATVSEPFLAGQNHYALFAEAAPNIDAIGVSAKDGQINRVIQDVLADLLGGKIASVDLALDAIEEKAKERFPDAVYP